MKISELIQSAVEQLKTAGIETAKLDAMILLGKVLGKERGYLIAHGNKEISAKQLKEFQKLLRRRLKREPVAQITGKKEFFGREFIVSKEVLTPRPETELIIEAALKRFPKNAQINILDLGTGSGCLILTLLLELPKAQGIGVDRAKTALAIAKRNAYNLKVQDVEFIYSYWCKNLELKSKFQLIVANPPYIPEAERRGLPAELGYEPKTALFSGDNGLKCYQEIAKEISALEFEVAIFEIGIGQQSEVKRIFERYNIKLDETLNDLRGIPRVMVFKKQ